MACGDVFVRYVKLGFARERMVVVFLVCFARERDFIYRLFGGLEIQITQLRFGIGLDLDSYRFLLRPISGVEPRRRVLVVVRARRAFTDFGNVVGVF